MQDPATATEPSEPPAPALTQSEPQQMADRPTVSDTSEPAPLPQDEGASLKDWIDSLGEFVPFLQTLLWILLILWILNKFKEELGAIVGAIKKRIEDGGAVEAGWFKLGALTPESTTAQAARAGQEAEESLSAGSESDDYDEDDSSDDYSDSSGGDSFRSRYYLAEDLALRRLQAEYGVVLGRQVAGGGGMRFDGFFAQGNRGNGIEVKYVRRRIPVPEFINQIEVIHQRVRNLNWKRFTLIFVIVTDDDYLPPAQEIDELRARIAAMDDSTFLRVLRFRDLADEFGIDLWESE